MVAVTLAQARDVVSRRNLDADTVFEVLAAIGRAGASTERHEAREMLIRVLARKESVPPSLIQLLHSLVREHGLFPYLDTPETLSLADRLAFEAHRPDGQLHDELVLHSEQSLVYERLMAGENVVLSAPTSFGKSRVVDAYLDARQFNNAVVVVPTIALIDETRRRLSRLAGDPANQTDVNSRYKIITHASQAPGERNLFVMTQERLLEYGAALPNIDFFVIDEFYKLDPDHAGDGSEHRSSQLNVAFDRLRRTGAQFYLLGPNITALENVSGDALSATFVSTNFTTVATDVDRVAATKDELPSELARVCKEAGPGTIVFCRSPSRIKQVATWLLENEVGFASVSDKPVPDDTNTESAGRLNRRGPDPQSIGVAADWVGENYHHDWTVTKALRAGIGIHHGRLPRALGHHMVRLFNEGRLPYLLVTSTLIEGVNTAARNVVILDHTIARKKYDYFTFANIRGRSGRMFEHFVGRVIVFNPEPRRADLTVEVPVLSQSAKTPPEILINLPEDELSAPSRARLEPFLDQSIVSVETLRSNRGVPLKTQMKFAEDIRTNPRSARVALGWRTPLPTNDQVRSMAGIIIDITGKSGAVRSAAQLAARINLMRRNQGDAKAAIAGDVEYGRSVDDAVEDHLEFVRNYAQFKVPTALVAAATIANDVVGPGTATDPAAFAGQLENLFQPPFVAVLEEFGLPSPTSMKLRQELRLDTATDLDEVLSNLRGVGATAVELHPFEEDMLADTQRTM